MTMAGVLIGVGVVATLAGVAAIVWCILAVRPARRAGNEADLRARMQRIMVVNMGALLASTIGLMLVVVGIILKR